MTSYFICQRFESHLFGLDICPATPFLASDSAHADRLGSGLSRRHLTQASLSAPQGQVVATVQADERRSSFPAVAGNAERPQTTRDAGDRVSAVVSGVPRSVEADGYRTILAADAQRVEVEPSVVRHDRDAPP